MGFHQAICHLLERDTWLRFDPADDLVPVIGQFGMVRPAAWTRGQLTRLALAAHQIDDETAARTKHLCGA